MFKPVTNTRINYSRGVTDTDVFTENNQLSGMLTLNSKVFYTKQQLNYHLLELSNDVRTLFKPVT